MPGLPIVLLVTTVANRELVARCCAQARAHGVSPGMPLAEARTLCPGGVGRLRVSAFEPDRSRQALDVLAKWALRFSPAVMVDPTSSNPYPIDSPDGLLLDVTGEAHLFGGEHPLVAEIASRVAWLGFSTRLAIAPTIVTSQSIVTRHPWGRPSVKRSMGFLTARAPSASARYVRDRLTAARPERATP